MAIRISRPIGKFAVALLALAASAEVTARIAWREGSHWMRPLARAQLEDPYNGFLHRRSETLGLHYELTPSLDAEINGYRVRTNTEGMRGPALRADARRIAVVGDSYAFGYGVQEHETFVARLGAALDARARTQSFEVLNLGVPGYSTADEAVVFAERALPLRPELVVLAYVLNDPDHRPRHPLYRAWAGDALWQHSAALRYLAKRRHDAEVERLGGGDAVRYLHAEDGPCWATVVDGLGDIAREADGLEVWVAVFPLCVGRTWDDYPYGEIHGRVVALAEVHGLRALDLWPAFRAAGVPPAELRLADGHPNPRMHAMAAESLAEALAPSLGLSE